MDVMKLYVARHGQTNYNELALCNADPSVDVHLTETGIQQAKLLADQLKNEPFDVIFVSELRRTQQTAVYVNKFHNKAVEIDARLNDNRTGFEGKPAQDYYDALKKADDMWTIRLHDGESLEDVRLRVESFINELRTSDHQAVLIVTSMTIVQMFCLQIQDLSFEQAWDIQVEKGSFVELEL